MKISQDRIHEITQLLNKETLLYNDLHGVASNVQDALVKNDIDRLSALVEQEDTLFTNAEQLRQDRFNILQQLKNDLELTDEEYTLGRMLEFMEEPDARCIEKLRDTLISSINKLDSVNRNNHVLVNYSLELNNKFMNLLTNLGQKENTVYHQSGHIKPESPKRRLLDKRA